jgi:nucleotide-binding universal stress UspA family protein
MFTRILVPLDGSKEAERALPIAARLARNAGGSVILVRVVRAPVEFEVGATPPATWAPAARPEERDEASAYLAATQGQAALADVPTTTMVYAGPAAAMILAAVASANADLIAMTSHGRTGMARWLLGSVAAEVARESSVPVFVLRGSDLPAALGMDRGTNQAPEAGQPQSQARPLSALVPLDGSHLAEAAIAPALQVLGALAPDAPLALRLLSVVEPLPLTAAAPLGAGVAGEGQIVLTELDRTMLGEAEEYLCSTAERIEREAGRLLPGRLVTVTWSAVWSPDVAHTLVSIAEAGRDGKGSAAQASALAPSDLIAMATHGHGGLRRWVMGSVADRVLHSTHLPMLVVRPSEVAAPPNGGQG